MKRYLENVSELRSTEKSELRDTPPELITSLWWYVFFRIRSFSFFEHQIIRVLTYQIAELQSFSCQSFALDQNVRTIRTSYLIRATLIRSSTFWSELLVFIVFRSFLVPVDLKQNRKNISSNRVRMFENFCLVSRYWF